METRTLIHLTFLLLLPCFLVKNRAADIVPAHSVVVGVVQSIQDAKYKIEFHPPNTHVHTDQDQEMIVMTDGDGRKYECSLPKPTKQPTVKKEESHQNSSSSISLTTDRRRRKTPSDLLDVLKDLCFARHEGWWTYELCYHGKFRQVHLENKKVVQEFILGVYDSEATSAFQRSSPDVSLQKDPRSRSAAQRYHSHLYTNGTTCDLTNDPRETEVRFVCADTGKNLINSITEAPTCKYTVIFHAPILCQHPLFQEERSQWLVIHCTEIPLNDEKVVFDDGDEEKQTSITGLLPSPDGHESE